MERTIIVTAGNLGGELGGPGWSQYCGSTSNEEKISTWWCRKG